MTDHKKLAAELETPLSYDPEIIGQLDQLSEVASGTLTQTESAEYFKNVKSVLTMAFRMARDENLSPIDAMNLKYGIYQFSTESSDNNHDLWSMYAWLAATKGHGAALYIKLTENILENEPLPYFSRDEYYHQPIGILLVARLVDIQRNADPKNGDHTALELQKLVTKSDGAYRTREDGDPALSDDDLKDLFQRSRQEIPDWKLDRTLMNYLYPNTSLTEEQINFLSEIEEEEVRVANGTSHWIKMDGAPAP